MRTAAAILMLTIAAWIVASSPQLLAWGWVLTFFLHEAVMPKANLPPLPEGYTLDIATPKADREMSAPSSPTVSNELSGLRARLHQCWLLPSGLTDMRPVTVIMRLNEDGTLSSPPQPESTADKAMVDSVVRAITRCQPYPAVARTGHREIEIDFSPMGE
jgi:hypothetical protein